jgi:hypothetical protein
LWLLLAPWSILLANLELVWRFRLFHPGHFVSGPTEFVGHGAVGNFWKSPMGHMSLHVDQIEYIRAHIGIHVKHFIEFAYIQNERANK